jgi:Flp pilus assembly protein TadD
VIIAGPQCTLTADIIESVDRRASFTALVLLCAPAAGQTAASGPDFQEAVAALQQGDSPAAEQKLRAELKTHPDEAEAMSLLGVALDNQKKFPEAD